MALVAGPDVPPYLRFVGSISIKSGAEDLIENTAVRPVTDELVSRICEDLWRDKTIYVLDEDRTVRKKVVKLV